MSTIHEALKKYLWDKTRGLVVLTLEDTKAITSIVQAKEAEVIFYKYSNMSQLYEKARTIPTSDAIAAKLVAQWQNKKPILGFARWDVYNSKGELLIQIHNLHYSLL